MVPIVIVCKDKENKLVFLYRMATTLTMLLLLIAPLLHTLYKWDHPQHKAMVHSGWEGYIDGCKQHSKGSDCYDWLLLFIWHSLSKALECMPFIYREEDSRNKKWSILYQGSIRNNIRHWKLLLVSCIASYEPFCLNYVNVASSYHVFSHVCMHICTVIAIHLAISTEFILHKTTIILLLRSI